MNEKLIQLTLNYLASKPYNEVSSLIEAWKEALKPKEGKDVNISKQETDSST